ncbi:MAG: LacI family DNA-binding transcriptional regulator [Oscillospiraceae bacterium]
MEDKKISMVDIAALAGVSIATVSRILNKNGRYSAATERKVLDIIEEYGYQINLSARTLRTNRSQSIGVIVPDITNEFFAKIIRSIENYLVPLDYTVFVCDSNEDEKTESRHITNLVAKDVDGIIYISGKSDVKKIYEQYQIPVVYIDRRPRNAGTLVISDNEKGGYLATKELLDSGCKRIVVLRDYRKLSPIRHRLAGYGRALNERKIPFDNSLIIDVTVDYSDARKKVNARIKGGMVFDGVFACTDMIGVGALHALLENNISVPGEVKVVGFDDISVSQICNPPMTTIRQDTDLFGKYSVEALLGLIENNRAKAQKFVVDVSLQKRSTT